MTHHPIRVEPDGTRVYSNHTRYRPLPDDERINQRRKPDDPRAVRFRGDWFLPLELVPEYERMWPETRPDTEAAEHMTAKRKCSCRVCRRPESEIWKRKWRKARGLA